MLKKFLQDFRVNRKKLKNIYSRNFNHRMILNLQMIHFCPEIDDFLVYCPLWDIFWSIVAKKTILLSIVSNRTLVHSLSQYGRLSQLLSQTRRQRFRQRWDTFSIMVSNGTFFELMSQTVSNGWLKFLTRKFLIPEFTYKNFSIKFQVQC